MDMFLVNMLCLSTKPLGEGNSQNLNSSHKALSRNMWYYFVITINIKHNAPYLQVLPKENKPTLETMLIIIVIDTTCICSSQGILKISI